MVESQKINRLYLIMLPRMTIGKDGAEQFRLCNFRRSVLKVLYADSQMVVRLHSFIVGNIEQARIRGRTAIPVFSQMFGVGVVVGTPGVRLPINALEHSISLLRVAIKCLRYQLGEHEVKRCCVHHLNMHEVMNSELERETVG